MDLEKEMAIFCENMRILRAIHHLSQKEMAKKIGIGVKSLSFIEHGNIPPRLSTEIVWQVSKCFDISPSALFKPMRNN